MNSRPHADVYRDLRAGAESGWDFSSRWCAKSHDLSTIETTSIAPIDLNCLMWGIERAIADTSRYANDQKIVEEFTARANSRQQAIEKHFWCESGQFYTDFNWVRRSQSSALTAATLMPLYFGMAENLRAQATAKTVAQQLLAKNGLLTTLHAVEQQWDSPNGWAPLQYIAIMGLRHYGQHALASEIAHRWLNMVQRIYNETGKLLEKYNVLTDKAGGGGEYPTQDGFGWTNGTYVVLSQLYPADHPDT